MTQAEMQIGTLKNVSEKFSRAYLAFLKYIAPLCSFSDEHKQERLQEARADNDHDELARALNELNKSINAFSCLYKNINRDT